MMPFDCRRRLPVDPLAALLLCALLAALAWPGAAQVIPGDGVIDEGNDFGGVYVDAQGVLRAREVAAGKGPDAVRKPAAKPGADKPMNLGPDGLTYVSLPRLFAEVRAATAAGKPVPDDLRHLGGLTQIRYVLLYPEQQDLVIAGPAEAWRPQGLFAVGRQTGRPVMQLDDLVVALRQEGAPFGCTIDPAPDSSKRAEEVACKHARSSRKTRLDALKAALGPQTAKVFGTPADTRMALALVAADYRLKRLALGADKAPIAGLGYAVDDSRAAACRLWFEPKYEPLLVSADGNAYELRGPRLQLKAGAYSFDPRGATGAARKYADTFTAKLPQLAQAVPLFAELQNIADLNVVAALIKADQLDRKAGWDTAWLRSRDGGCPVKQVAVPRQADTVVNVTSGSMVAGGVEMSVSRWVAPASRELDNGGHLLTPARIRAAELLKGSGGGALMNAPSTASDNPTPTSAAK
jgi:hypothetical protein